MINIAAKTDIVIPFDKIGDKGWEIKTRSLIESLAENWNEELPEPQTEEDILALENRLGAVLPESLKLFYKTFGVAPVGEQLLEIDEIDWLENLWNDAPEWAPAFTDEEKAVLPCLIMFSDYLGNGDIFCFHKETKEVYFFNHDTPPFLTQLFDTVDDYLKGCLICCQTDLFAPGCEQQLEEWTLEVVRGLFGEEIVRKWQYSG